MRAIALTFIVIQLRLFAAEYYVSPSAGSGSGTIVSPWHLQVALTNVLIVPGDTVWLRGGTYSNNLWNTGFGTNWANPSGSWFITLKGSPENPIVWRSYPNESAKIDRPWHFGTVDDANWNQFQDLEFYDSFKGQYTTNTGELIYPIHFNGLGASNQWVNCYIHDVNTCWGGSAGGVSIRGCIINYVGNSVLEHTIYPYCQDVAGNIMGWGTGYHIQYGAEGINVRSNIMFGAGVLGGSHGLYHILWLAHSGRIDGNVLWDGKYSSGGVKLSPSGSNVVVMNNFIAARTPVQVISQSELTFSNNTLHVQDNSAAYQVFGIEIAAGPWGMDNNHYSAVSPLSVLFNDNGPLRTFDQWKSEHPTFDSNSTSTNSSLPSDRVWVFPNLDSPKRANIAVFNGSSNDVVAVDVSSVLAAGDTYRLYSAQNYGAGPIQTGTFNGTNITVTMTNLTVAPILYGVVDRYNHTNLFGPNPISPEFGAFVLIGSTTSSAKTLRSATASVAIFR